jgi:hypothetical protein
LRDLRGGKERGVKRVGWEERWREGEGKKGGGKREKERTGDEGGRVRK